MSFLAKYPGACAEGDRIHVDDEVKYGDDGELRHVTCAGDDFDAARVAPHEMLCDRCFLIHPIGECP